MNDNENLVSTSGNTVNGNVVDGYTVDGSGGAINHVPTVGYTTPTDGNLILENIPEKKSGGFAGTKPPMFHKNISRVIRWYKGRCSFEMRKIQPNF